MNTQYSEGALYGGRPPQVLVAVIILLVSVAIGSVYALHLLTAPSMSVLPGGIVLASVAVAYAILKRQRWARLLLLVVTLLGGAALLASFIAVPLSNESAMMYSIRAAQSALRFTAVYFLFTEPARNWFRGALG